MFFYELISFLKAFMIGSDIFKSFLRIYNSTEFIGKPNPPNLADSG